MTLKTCWYETDSRFIPGHYQPAALIDLALSRDIDSHRLLRGTGLFHDDILAGQSRISPQQFLGLIDNSRRLLDASDSSFLFGQRLLPGVRPREPRFASRAELASGPADPDRPAGTAQPVGGPSAATGRALRLRPLARQLRCRRTMALRAGSEHDLDGGDECLAQRRTLALAVQFSPRRAALRRTILGAPG